MKIKVITVLAVMAVFLSLSFESRAEDCPASHCSSLGEALTATCTALKEMTNRELKDLSAPFYDKASGLSCKCPCSCFTTGSTVSLSEGDAAVESIEAGMEFRTLAGPVKANHVLSSTVEAAKVVVLSFSNGKSVSVSDNHPFILDGGIVTDAKSLRKGAAILGENGEVVNVTSARDANYSGVLHNFTLAGSDPTGSDRVLFTNGVQTGDWKVMSYRDRMNAAVSLRSLIAEMN